MYENYIVVGDANCLYTLLNVLADTGAIKEVTCSRSLFPNPYIQKITIQTPFTLIIFRNANEAGVLVKVIKDGEVADRHIYTDATIQMLYNHMIDTMKAHNYKV